jgi:hypothetical protein
MTTETLTPEQTALVAAFWRDEVQRTALTLTTHERRLNELAATVRELKRRLPKNQSTRKHLRTY